MIRSLLLLAAPALLLAQAVPPAAEPTPPAPAAPPAEQVLRVPEPGRFKRLFEPFRTDNAALSPDGKYLAYSIREGDALSVLVVEVDHPGTAKTKVKVIDDEGATPMLEMEQKENTPGMIRWMRWVTPTRLVVETNRVFARPGTAGNWQSWRGAILAFNADGTDARQLISPTDLPEFADDPGTRFSTARNRESIPDGFNPAQGDNEPMVGDEEFSDAQSPGQPAATFGGTQPRSLQVFDVDPKRPGALNLISFGGPRSVGNRSLGFHSLNAQNGKLTDLTNDLVLVSRSTLIDRQGFVRLTLPNSLLSNFPFRYEYLGPKGRTRAKPLDETAGLKGFAVSPDNYFGERSVPLGFDENPNILYYASNVGRDTYGIYSYDLTTKQRGKVSLENPAYDLIGAPTTGFPGNDALIFDRYRHELIGIRYDNAFRTTAWLRPEWQGLQQQFEKLFPGRIVEIADWDEAGNRFVFSTEGPADPGAYYVYDRTTNKLMEFVRRAPWIDEKLTNATLPFSFATADGSRISGLVTVPQQPRLKPIPMVILCPDLPWLRVRADFKPEVQALADMGFVVVQLNGRGAWGFGLKQRQSLTTGYDLVQVEDIVNTLTALEKVFTVNLRRVAVMGRGHGGFIALRALQAHPDKFRCAIALEAPVNLADWLAGQRWSDGEAQPELTRAWLGDAARLKAAPLTSSPETVTKPVLLLNYPGPAGAIHRQEYVAARGFAGRVRSQGGTAEFGDLPTDYMRGLPDARAAVFDQLEEFLNVNVYDFKVKLQEMQIIR
jgi:hypothetical protein